MTNADTTWDLNGEQQTTTVDGLVSTTVPTVVVGETVTFEFYIDSSSTNATDFNNVKQYIEFVNSSSSDYGTTYDGVPWYRFSSYPGSNISSLLFEVVPTARIPDLFPFWGLLIDATDTSELTQTGGRFEITFFVIAESAEYTRTQVVSEFKGDL